MTLAAVGTGHPSDVAAPAGHLCHDATGVQLYSQESVTFVVYTTEAGVAMQLPPDREHWATACQSAFQC